MGKHVATTTSTTLEESRTAAGTRCSSDSATVQPQQREQYQKQKQHRQKQLKSNIENVEGENAGKATGSKELIKISHAYRKSICDKHCTMQTIRDKYKQTASTHKRST